MLVFPSPKSHATATIVPSLSFEPALLNVTAAPSLAEEGALTTAVGFLEEIVSDAVNLESVDPPPQPAITANADIIRDLSPIFCKEFILDLQCAFKEMPAGERTLKGGYSRSDARNALVFS